MRAGTAILLVLLSSMATGRAWGYGKRMHDKASIEAASRSVLAPSRGDYMQAELQFAPDHRFTLGSEGDGKAEDWLATGSQDEDNGVRMCNHFYNPMFPEDSRGLHAWYTHIPQTTCAEARASSDWGLEDEGNYDYQEYSFKDARQRFYEALKGDTPKDRDDQFAKMFYALGHVIHLVQDLASPQHTRNDGHLLAYIKNEKMGITSNRGLYEQYTEENLSKVPCLKDAACDYPAVDLPTPRAYWDVEELTGLAEYSNKGFVTTGTNFRITSSQGHPQFIGSCAFIESAPGLPLPNGYMNGCEVVKKAVQDVIQGTTLVGEIDFVKTPVYDHYQAVDPPQFNERTSTYSIFAADLQNYNWVSASGDDDTKIKEAAFTLNLKNFEAAWPFLIPRAVGYSAGLINYFFRGRLEFQRSDQCSSEGIAWTVTNKGTETLEGTFQFFYDEVGGEHDGRRHELEVLSVDGQAPDDVTLEPDDSVEVVTMRPEEGVVLSEDTPYTLVFRGKMGAEEGAVAGKVKKLPSSAFLLVGDSATYRSDHLACGWQRIGNGALLGYPYDTQPFSRAAGQGHYIDEHAIIISGAQWDWGWSYPRFLRSTDGGRTFVDIFPSVFPQYDAWDGAMTYLGGTEVLAASYYRDYGNGGIRRSMDCGQSWSAETATTPRFNFLMGLLGIGTDSVILNSWRLWPDQEQPYHTLWASADGGLSWADLPPSVDGMPLQGCQWQPQTGVRCQERWQLRSLAWNQIDGPGSVILALGIMNFYGSGQYRSIWKSEDGGRSWTTAKPVGDAWAGSVAINDSNLALALEGESNSWDKVLSVSTDGGDTWTEADLPAGEPSAQFHTVVSLSNDRLGEAHCP